MTNDRETAAKIIDEHYESGRNFMYAAIVAALEAARDTAFVAGYAAGLDHLRYAIESRGIIDCTGEVPCVRRVLGVLPVTADGFVIGENATVWMEDFNWQTMGRRRFYEYHSGDLRTHRDSWSTESAARAAMEGGQ